MKATLLQNIAAKAMHQEGRKRDWWPFGTEEELLQYYANKNIRLRGNSDFVAVGLGRGQDLVIREFDSIQDLADLSDKAFTLSYSSINERLADEFEY